MEILARNITPNSMDSNEIADLVESRPDNVKRTIERLAVKGVIAFPPLEEKPTAGRSAKVYVFTGEKGKRDSIIVVAQLCPEFTARLVDRWQELERKDAQPVEKPKELSRMELIQIAFEAEKENIALRGELAIAAPKAEALDVIADTSNTYCLRECAKTIGIQEKDLIQLLIDKKWIYREPSKTLGKAGKLQPHAQYVMNKVFINRISPVITNQYTGQEMVHTHMRVTAFGLTRITRLVNKTKKEKKVA